jgi:phenylacetate-coenzyme A ligase PaaK-like adenylate-forming protein
MANFGEWVTDRQVRRVDVENFIADPANIGRPYLGRYLVFTTSGTTGTPALLMHDDMSMEVLQACLLIRTVPRMLAAGTVRAVLRGGGRSASVWVTDRPFGGASLLQRQIIQRPSRAKRLRIFSALTPVDDLVAQLNAFQPVMLSGYASVLALLANEQRAGRLRIHPVLINNGGETLTSPARALIEGAFGTSVSNGYGCSEMISVAFECRSGSLHVHADWALLEPVDENRNAVPAGEPSATVLLTNLANRIQPLIRYDLGDSVTVIDQACPCGSVLPRIDVVGRTNELLRFAAPDGRTVELLPLPVVTLAEGVPGVRSVQFIQRGPRSLVVRLATAGGSTDRSEVWRAVSGQLDAYFARLGATTVACTLDAEPPRREPGSGKLRQVITGFNGPSAYPA